MLCRILLFLGVYFCLLPFFRSVSFALSSFDSFHSNFGEVTTLENGVPGKPTSRNSTFPSVETEKFYSNNEAYSSNNDEQFNDHTLLAQVEPKKTFSIAKDASELSSSTEPIPQVLSSNKNKSSQNVSSPETSFLNADFFADSLSDAFTIEEDPMGSQRLLQVRDSTLSPSVSASTSFNYTSNPDKVENPSRRDGTSLNLSLSLNLGLGEYGLGDEVILAPALSFVQMRTFTDPFHDFGNEMRVYDLDTQIASLSFPFVLPNEFTLILSHSYVVPSTFRGRKEVISYSNTPSFALSKNFILPNGDAINFTAGTSFTFSEGDTLEQQINDPVYFSFIEAVMQQSGSSPTSDYPSNLQDSITMSLSLAYSKSLTETISLAPSLSFQSISFTEGANKSREDKIYNVGVSASKMFAEWLSLSSMINYSVKKTNDINTPEFDDLIGGVTLGVNYSF